MKKIAVVCVLAVLAASAFAMKEVILDGHEFVEIRPEDAKYDTPSLPIEDGLLGDDLLKDYSWKGCLTIGRFGSLCGVITARISTLTIVGTVSWNGHRIFQYTFSAGTICATERDIIEMVSYIPALAEFKPIIDEVLKAMKYLPATVVSVCLHAYNIHWVNHHLKACVSASVTLFCWQGQCAWKGGDNLGCFTI